MSKMNHSEKVCAIVLGRAGSKGVPGKNMARIAGKPCAQWTIEAALASETIGEVIVSSDDGLMLELAESLGTSPHLRSDELASDTARVDDAAREAAMGCDAGVFVILYANAPVRPEGLIDRAVRLLVKTGCDSVQSYAPVGKHHPWWTAKVDNDGSVEPWEGDTLNHGIYRRQDLPDAFVPDGGVIALTRQALFLEIKGVEPGPHAFFGRDRRGVVTAEGAVVDIDSPIDLVVAHAVLADRAAGVVA